MFCCHMTRARAARLVTLFVIAFVSEAASQQNPAQTTPETPAGGTTQGATPDAVPRDDPFFKGLSAALQKRLLSHECRGGPFLQFCI